MKVFQRKIFININIILLHYVDNDHYRYGPKAQKIIFLG